jgi:transposase
MAKRGVRLTDKQWEKLEPLLPPVPTRQRGGRPVIGHRAVLDGILWVLKTGARWRDLPDEYPSPSTCWRRLQQWEEQGVWLRIWRAFLGQLDERGRLDWENVFIDGSFAPAKKGGLTSEPPRGGRAQSSWWWSTARVFLWECPLPRPHQRKSRSSPKR